MSNTLHSLLISLQEGDFFIPGDVMEADDEGVEDKLNGMFKRVWLVVF